jgi:hypothetical protein
MDVVRHTLEAAGVEFIDENGGGAGGALPKAGEKRDLKVASLTTPTVTITNVLAIGRTMEDARGKFIDENGLDWACASRGASWILMFCILPATPIDGRPNPIGPVCFRSRRIRRTIWEAIWLPRSGSC